MQFGIDVVRLGIQGFVFDFFAEGGRTGESIVVSIRRIGTLCIEPMTRTQDVNLCPTLSLE